jgi:hypothetical protein
MNKAFVGIGLLLVFVGVSWAQKVGGYKEIAVTDSGVQEAADFAASAEAEKANRTIKLLKINKAEVQVVAGRNYRMCLKVQSSGGEDEADTIFTVTTVVYVDLKGNKKLSSWAAADCGDDDDDD